MSSNIKTKNTIYSFSKYDQLPYQSSQMIDYGVDNQYVNSGSFNNTYGQCVDNDMFIAKKILSKLNGRNTLGPKIISSSAEVEKLPNGTKFFSSSGDINILQKKVASFQDTLTKCTSPEFTSVNAIHPIGSNTALICTASRTYVATADEISDSTFIPSIQIKDDIGQDVVITSALQHGRYAMQVFAGKSVGSSQPSIYFLGIRSTSNPSYVLKNILQLDISDPVIAMSMHDSNHTLYFSTASTVYSCELRDGYLVESHHAIGSFNEIAGTGDVCALLAVESKVIVFTSNGNAYNILDSSDQSESHIGFINAAISDISGNDGIVVNDVKTGFGGVQYLATNKGLAVLRFGKIELIYTASEVNRLYVDNSGTIWCGDAEGNILQSSSPSSVVTYASLQNGYSITDFRIVNEIKIAVTQSNGIWYENSHQNFQPLEALNDGEIDLANDHVLSAKIITDASSSKNQMFVACLSASSGEADALSTIVADVSLQTNGQVTDYSTVDGLTAKTNFDREGYTAKIVGLVTANAKIYAFVNMINDDSTSNSYSFIYEFTEDEIIDEDAGRLYIGVAKPPSTSSSHSFYAFSTVDVTKYAGSITESTIMNLPQWFADKQILGCSFIEDGKWLMTVSSSSGQNFIAYVAISNVAPYVIDYFQIGVPSNVICYNGQHLAYVRPSNSDSSMLSSFGICTMLLPQTFNADQQEQIQLTEYFNSNQFQLVNNLSYRLDNSLIFRRADYLVPAPDSSSNISVVNSFLKAMVDDEQAVQVKGIEIEEIENTAHVHDFSQAYDISCYTATSYISDTYAVYTFQIDESDSKIFNPSQPFTTEFKFNNDNVKYSIINALSVDDTWDDGKLVEFNASLSAYEISSDSTLNLISCNLKMSRPLDAAAWNEQSRDKGSLSIDTHGLTPLMMCKRASDVFVLLSSSVQSETQYTVLSICDGIHVSDPIVTFTQPDEPKSFIFASNGDFNEMLQDFSDPSKLNLDIQGNTYQECLEAIDSNGYTYDVHHTILDNAGIGSFGEMHITFSSCDYSIQHNDQQEQQWTSSQLSWIEADPDYAITFNQVPNILENVLFTYSICNSTDLNLLFKLQNSLAYWSFDPRLYGKDVDDSLTDVVFIGQDIDIDQVIIGKYDTDDSNALDLSVIHDNDLSSARIENCEDVCLSSINIIQWKHAYGDQVSSYEALVYVEDTDDSSQLMMTGIGDGTGASLLTSSSSHIQLNVLNQPLQVDEADEHNYPVIVHDSSASALKYAVNHVVLPKCSQQQRYTAENTGGLQDFVIDADNSKKVYVVCGNDISAVSFESDSSPEASLVKSIEGLTNIVFPDYTFGGSISAYVQYETWNEVWNEGIRSMMLNSLGNTLPIDDQSATERMVKFSTVRFIDAEIGWYTLYGTYNSSAYAMRYINVGEIDSVEFNSNASLDMNEKANDIVQIGQSNSYAIQTQNYIYEYSFINGLETMHVLLNYFDDGGNLQMLVKYENEDMHQYFIGKGNQLLASDNLTHWTSVMSVGQDQDSGLDSFALINQNVSLAGQSRGLDSGLYFTYYKYVIDNNTSPFTAQSAYTAYYDNYDSIENVLENNIEYHVNTDHIDPNGDMTLVNTYMGVDFDISGFMKMTDYSDISNDYIDQILTGNAVDGSVLAYSCNTAMNSKWTPLECTYIAKCWKSGMTDLYIYLPTTNTFYIPHIEGASQCISYDEEVVINGRTLTANIRDNITSVRVNIASSLFAIDTLIENTIKPNSLPLRVFKDDTSLEGDVHAMYHSFVQPSVAEDFSLDDQHLGYYAFNYFCFGSDAQALKLSFFNANPRYDEPYKTVEYIANGGYLSYFPGMKSIKQRIYQKAGQVELYQEIFSRDGSFFIGWSQVKNAVDGDPLFSPGATVSYESLKQRSLVLYACWVTYNFSDNDTTITIANTSPADYTIAEITIDPNATIPNNPALGNKLIIDYGDQA